jgi:hypothetical protein
MPWGENPLDRLVGKVIERIEVSDVEEDMRFTFADGSDPLIVSAYGDCCSVSWFADIIGVSALLGHEVTDVIELQLPQDWMGGDERSRQEHDIVYGYRITTALGDVTLAFRNSSNGYYGGDLVVNPVGEWVERLRWREIVDEDWRA